MGLGRQLVPAAIHNSHSPLRIVRHKRLRDLFCKSIAIDRTGKSPNPIEDINMQPRSIGFFLVPPGDAIREGSVLDVYRVAEDAKNPGAVRRLSPKDLDRSETSGDQDPLRAILKQFQKQRAAFLNKSDDQPSESENQQPSSQDATVDSNRVVDIPVRVFKPQRIATHSLCD